MSAAPAPPPPPAPAPAAPRGSVTSTASGGGSTPNSPSSSSSSPSSDGTVPAYLNFVPGGVGYPTATAGTACGTAGQANATALASAADAINAAILNHYHHLTSSGDPTKSNTVSARLIAKAVQSDSKLREMALMSHAKAKEIQDNKSDEDVDMEMDGPEEEGAKVPSAKAEEETSEPPPILLPSLSILAESAFGTLTGVAPASVRKWADALVMAYLDDVDSDAAGEGGEDIKVVLEQIRRSASVASPTSPTGDGKGTTGGEEENIDLPTLLRTLHSHYVTKSTSGSGDKSLTVPTRPCGYVFRRGDIAWNCRTCQSDSTCVLCDACFRESDHTGHEVFFHRTSPGGCCDCGDVEAWRVEGCCDRHRPRVDVEEAMRKKMKLSDSKEAGTAMATAAVAMDDDDDDDDDVNANDPDHEAVRSSNRSRKETADAVQSLLPPRLAAALGVVIGNAVQSIVRSVDGSAIGSDPVQWEKRWSDQARRVRDGCSTDEDYLLKGAAAAAAASGTTGEDAEGSPTWSPAPDGADLGPLPPRFRLHLRLHNDDVHTFEEVIDALYAPPSATSPAYRRARGGLSSDETDTSHGLVPHRSDADDMTHHVDSDGQVTVRVYSTLAGALAGYRRLKSRGLHCSVVSTPQVDSELRSRALLLWLAELCSAHPAMGGMVVHALVDVDDGCNSSDIGGVRVWREGRSIPSWALGDDEASAQWASAFPPHLNSSYLSREEAERLHSIGFGMFASPGREAMISPEDFAARTGADRTFYAGIPQPRLPSERYRKSPHALWGTMVLPENNDTANDGTEVPHPLLSKSHASSSDKSPPLLERLLVIDTDMRKPQEADRLTAAMFPHQLSGLSMISGVGIAGTSAGEADWEAQPPTDEEWSRILSTASYASPASPILLTLLLDPYPPKLLRQPLHSLFLSLLIDARFKSRFAAALGGVAYRSLTTLFCAGVGTESDTPLGFTVQIFTAGSLVRALGNPTAATKLLCRDGRDEGPTGVGPHVLTIPIAHNIVRCIHSNLLGATKEVKEATKIAASSETVGANGTGEVVNPALVYPSGEHSMTALLPAAPDDGFLDSRSTRHKRLPHLLRDLEYIFETPSTSVRLLLAVVAATAQTNNANVQSLPQILNIDPSACLTFPTVWARLLRLGQGMDPQKRRISGGHVEYEQNRWLEAFGLSLNLAGAYDALAESPAASGVGGMGSDLENLRISVGNLFASLLKEIKLWLYKEGLLDTGVPMPPTSGALGDLGQLEALQRSTLHLSSSQLGTTPNGEGKIGSNGTIGAPTVNTIALSCATSVKMTEAQLSLMEQALRIEAETAASGAGNTVRGAVMGDWLRCPHAPLAGDCLSFHLPLHRALARSLRSICSVTVSQSERDASLMGWWKLPALDDDTPVNDVNSLQHPLAALIRPTIRSSNCRVVWAAGPECSSQEAQARRARSRLVSSSIAAAKIIHSLCDHPLRCLVASQQIERHLWARNGSAAAGMALNYGSAPLCRSFRDLDLTMVQFSAAGLSIGLGARRVFSLLLSRFSLEGYLCDPERRGSGLSPTGSVGSGGGSPSSYGSSSGWVNPPRMQDPDHAVALTECFFSTLCVLVTELPSPPPSSATDNASLRTNMKRELLHALAAEPRSHSEAMAAVSGAVTRRDETESGAGTGDADSSTSFRAVFADVLKEIGKQKSQGSRSTGAPTFELKADASDEYDPTFFHLRRHEHQHAMDTVARLRRQKISPPGSPRSGGNAKCLPLVTPPPTSHPRFVPCRLVLHLPAIDASIRRALLFALTGGRWLPPDEPHRFLGDDEDDDEILPTSSGGDLSTGSMSTGASPDSTPTAARARRRAYQRNSSSSFVKPKRGGSLLSDLGDPFSPETVAASSVSFLEVLQILTLQVHTLEECASLHHSHALDEESRGISAGLSINSYLGRLVLTPPSLVDVWALRCAPDGPLPSKGSGANRGSVLGLLIALYEHRADHGGASNKGGDSGHADEGHGGARALTADGLKWLLRFVNSLVDGAPSVGAACQSASSGIRYRPTSEGSAHPSSADTDGTMWTINPEVRDLVAGMLANLADLWPTEVDSASGAGDAGAVSAKSREARKAAQRRAMERMMKAQSSFAASISVDNGGNNNLAEGDADEDEEADLCIICRCDDADGEINGPLGFLGHVQRSRALQLRSMAEVGRLDEVNHELHRTYRVVGDRGCQLRATEAMTSRPVSCLGVGSIVTLLESKVSPKYDLLSRRVRVRHTDPKTNETIEGWASIQSSQGYVILSPLSTLCYNNSRWGSTRPVIRQCGHAAHLRCVEAHCLSLHQRAAGDQPYDGRFAANIDDGEFLCPLCKQLSNILIPDIGRSTASQSLSRKNSTASSSSTSELADINGGSKKETSPLPMVLSSSSNSISSIRDILCSTSQINYEEMKGKEDKMATAIKQFGAHLYQAMQIPWDKTSAAKKREQKAWHPALRRWDFEEDEEDDIFSSSSDGEVKDPVIGAILRLLRQQHIAWASVGHSAASAEAASRGVTGIEDPWSDYTESTRDTNAAILDLKRTVTATSGLLELLAYELGQDLGSDSLKSRGMTVTLVGSLLADILEGRFWTIGVPSSPDAATQQSIFEQWQVITGLLAATPCHVARDGMLSQRHEARGTAASLWATKGPGFLSVRKKEQKNLASTDSQGQAQAQADVAEAAAVAEETMPSAEATSSGIEISPEAPVLPTPLAIRRVCSEQGINQPLASSWGTLDPFVASQPPTPVVKDSVEIHLSSGKQAIDPTVPFRPAVASAYLYVPLLAWDMNTLAGAVFSSMLVNKDPSTQAGNDDLLLSSRMLLIGRMVQVFITPEGFDNTKQIDPNDWEAQEARDEFKNHWQREEVMREAKSLADLLKHCRHAVGLKSSHSKSHEIDSEEDAYQFMHHVGLAILPFARSLVLLLRASASILRQREKKERREKKSMIEKPTSSETVFAILLDNPETMTFEDGFRILKVMGGPLPSQVMVDVSSPDVSGSPSSWFALINRWLAAIRGFEAYHGSRGKGLVFDAKSGAWVSSNTLNSEGQADGTDSEQEESKKKFIVQEQSVQTASSSEGTMGVEVEVAPSGAQGEEQAGLAYNASIDMDDASDAEYEEMEDGDEDEGLAVDVNVDMLDMEDDDSDEAEMEDVEMAGQMDFGGANHGPSMYGIEESGGDASDDNSSCTSSTGLSGASRLDKDFAHLSCSAIIPFQPSLLGAEEVGPGPRGGSFEYSIASSVMSDLSHLGMVHRVGATGSGLIRLPRSFVELYSLVNKVKGRSDTSNGAMDDPDDGGSTETAICLLTGAIMASGTSRRHYSRAARPPGACTLHARQVGSGIGIFFLVQKCTVLLVHNNKSAYSASLYVDEHGEEDPGLRRGRPLFLKDERYEALETLWRQHAVPREVAQTRSTSDRVIRDNWY